MMLTLLVLFLLLLFYGIFRAVYYAEKGAAALPAGGTPVPGIGPATPFFAGAAPAPPPQPLFAPNAAGAATTQPAAVAANPVVGNRSLGIYHLPDCDWAARVAARQRADFDSPASALAAGYRPCRVCKP
jgi:hypothetical protein